MPAEKRMERDPKLSEDSFKPRHSVDLELPILPTSVSSIGRLRS